MQKEPIAILPYDKVDFNFVSSYYDMNLNGSCTFQNSLCEFQGLQPDYNDEKEEFEEIYVEIYKLNIIEKFKWLWKQWLFEKCVGYHYSYKNNKNIKGFYYRNPKWLYKYIFNLYYKLNNINNYWRILGKILKKKLFL